MAPRRLGWNVVGTALNSRKPGAISKSGLVLKRENHPFKNNFTTEPIVAPPTLSFCCWEYQLDASFSIDK
ncbi:hypothetical protein B4585_07815 [Lacticaseibacillus paracasei]|nr:hypothetical protein B4585_07815 [Lacticaseibacillus paracasei]